MKHLPLILAAVALVGCQPVGFGPGGQDFTASLAHGYFVDRSSAHQITISSHGLNPDTPAIPTKVIELDHDGQFVIAKQQLLERRSPDDPNDTYEQPKPNSFQYWILDMATPKLHGPLTRDEFTTERSRLAVPSQLKLHNVYDYQP